MHTLKITAYILVLIGALNWGLIGFFNFDLVAAIFNDMSFLSRTIYSVVGISALTLLFINADIFNKADTRC